MIGAGRTSGNIGPAEVALAGTQEHVAGAAAGLAVARVPPAVPEIRTRRPLACHQRVTGAVPDVGQPNFGIKEQHAVGTVISRSQHADIGATGKWTDPQNYQSSPRISPAAGVTAPQ